MQRCVEEDQELHEDRLVEAELRVDPRDVRVGRPVAEDGARRVARQQPHQHEVTTMMRMKRRDDLQQPRRM